MKRIESAGLDLTQLILIVLIGCSTGFSQSSVAKNNHPSTNNLVENQNAQGTIAAANSQLVSANTRFGFKLFAEVAKQDAGKNVFLSPASVGLALAMTYNGAVGETKQAMERALEIQGMNHLELNQAYSQLRSALKSADPKVQLNIANSLWGKKGLTFNPDFVERNKQYYGAEVTALDFSDPGAPSTINAWVSDKTKGKINKIMDTIDSQAILFLINAIYFKGTWTTEFDKAKTKEEQFTTLPGKQKLHPMMHQSGKYFYFQGDGFQAVSLPYGSGQVSMYLFLPAKGSSLVEFQKKLSAASWDSWMRRFVLTDGEIAVPRFKVQYDITLNDALKALGMGIAFEPGRADFSGIIKSSEAFISEVKHKALAEVNEEGTVAAAVTSVGVFVTSAGPEPKPFRMIVDHPFFCAIRDNKTGTLLFMGSITDPSR
jgi:serpin B